MWYLQMEGNAKKLKKKTEANKKLQKEFVLLIEKKRIALERDAEVA